MIYLDACYIAKLYVPEQDSSAIKAAVKADGLVACSSHGQAEVFSVFHRKLREKAVTALEFDALCLQFETEAPTAKFLWLPLTRRCCAVRAGISNPSPTPLSSGRRMHFISQPPPTKAL